MDTASQQENDDGALHGLSTELRFSDDGQAQQQPDHQGDRAQDVNQIQNKLDSGRSGLINLGRIRASLHNAGFLTFSALAVRQWKTL